VDLDYAFIFIYMAFTAKLMQIQGLKTGTRLLAIAVLIGVGLLTTASTEAESPPLTIFENVTLAPNFAPDPTTVRGVSGGPKTASEIAGRGDTTTGPCNGFVDEQPDHTIQLKQFFQYLSLEVQSSDDTTLVIRGPGGTWCNDDYSGKNPGIAGQWLSGTYQIWIGSYKQNIYSPYVIRMSEIRQ
jgi:hypothetical protein